ncbi:hypothetical protein D0T51_07805 [Parabacteroides sp. 52]|uniref:hypothetical protein n=1 Tax=unclassified Parabacteroides TaxID=2649774 RepID=UPI0013D4229C|nr:MULTISPECIES: hypothetical protein [unclassified Parabacteroides]MDH6535232.1 hypothetical protein [Parabacteroides sp. PM5-20]NDV55628.1 hypothetical protein [Parabacteroides sp. 52]
MRKYSILFVFVLSIVSLQAELRERIYLQTDKQLYMAGELLWMKMFTTDTEGRLQDFSKIGYVELIADSLAENQVKLDIRKGVAAGWMELSPMLPTGYYRLVAYTRHMQNEGEEVFFEKEIGIINPYLKDEDTIAETEKEDMERKDNRIISSEFLSTNRSSYGKRERGELKITGLPIDDLSMVVSIAGLDPLFKSSATLTNWKASLSDIPQKMLRDDFLPEYEGAVIEGRLIGVETGEQVKDVTVPTLLSFPGKDIQVYGGQINKEGKISFYTHQIAGKKEAVAVVPPSSEGNYQIDLFSPFAIHTKKEQSPLKISSHWHDYLEERALGVQITEAYTADSLSKVKTLPPYFNYKPYREYLLDEYTRFHYMEEIFIEYILAARIRKTGDKKRFSLLTEKMDGYATGQPLVLFDNIPVMNHQLMIDYNPLLVRKIDLYLGRYFFGGQIYDGIISFWSYNNNYPNITFDSSTQIFDYDGTQAYRYFYAPAYDQQEISDRMPDFRHTLLWEPSLQSEGKKELTLPFYTSDVSGTFLITVEGLGKNGTVYTATHTIEVE